MLVFYMILEFHMDARSWYSFMDVTHSFREKVVCLLDDGRVTRMELLCAEREIFVDGTYCRDDKTVGICQSCVCIFNIHVVTITKKNIRST